jgi:hypothetical protein
MRSRILLVLTAANVDPELLEEDLAPCRHR